MSRISKTELRAKEAAERETARAEFEATRLTKWAHVWALALQLRYILDQDSTYTAQRDVQSHFEDFKIDAIREVFGLQSWYPEHSHNNLTPDTYESALSWLTDAKASYFAWKAEQERIHKVRLGALEKLTDEEKNALQIPGYLRR